MESASVARLRPCRVCQGLTDAEIARVAEACSWRELPPGETLTSPGDSEFALYTVTRGRLRVYRGRDESTEKFVGYAILGDTIGQASLMSENLDEDARVVADIESDVAVIHRGRALRLVFEIPRFRENLVVSFGLRIDNLLRGRLPRRFPKVVGVVSSRTSERSGRFLPLLARKLQDRNEQVSIFSDRSERIPPGSKNPVVALSTDGESSKSLRRRIDEQLATAKRILLDIVMPAAADALSEYADACDEFLWCCDPSDEDTFSNTTLDRLASDHPSLRSRIVCVQILSDDDGVGRREPSCRQLVQRDFLLPLGPEHQSPGRLEIQGIDRIVRHLHGVKIGLALGGGGARGLAHLGVLRALDRAGISVDLMSGTSAGAMIGLGYAAGLDTDAMADSYSSELQPPSWMEHIPGGRRLYLFSKFRGDAWEQMLRRYYHDWTFQQLLIPCSVVATDLVSGEQVVRESGDIVHAILESINVPMMSEPILKDGKILVDGGVLNNLPAELLTDHGAAYVIGVDVSKEIPNHFAGNYSSMKTNEMSKPGNLETAHRIMEVSRRGITRLQMNAADIVIEPDTSAFDFADFTKSHGIAETGEAAAEALMPKIEQAYQDLMAEN